MSVLRAETAAQEALASLCNTTRAHNLHLPGLRRVENAGIPPLSRHAYAPNNTPKTQAEAMAVLEIFIIAYLYRTDAARGEGGLIGRCGVDIVDAFDVSHRTKEVGSGRRSWREG